MADEIFDIDGEQQHNAIVSGLEDRINKANALNFMVNTEGWDIMLSTFQDMKDAQMDIMYEQTPGNEKAIIAAHAVWYSVCKTVDNIVDAVSGAIKDGENAKIDLMTIRQQAREEEF